MPGSPAVAAGVVILCHTAINAFDAKSGARLWEQPRAKGLPIPLVWHHADRSYFVVNGQQGIELVDPKTGKSLWSIPEPPDCPSSLAVSGDILVMPYRNIGGQGMRSKPSEEHTRNGMSAFRIRPDGYEELWRLNRPPAHGQQYPPPVISRGVAYGCIYGKVGTAIGSGEGDRHICAVELLTGRVQHYSNPLRGSGYSPLCVEGRLLGSPGDCVFMLAADDLRILTEKWEVPIAESTSFAYANGLIFFRSDHPDGCYVKCYDLRAP
jgi:hypothetical protein